MLLGVIFACLLIIAAVVFWLKQSGNRRKIVGYVTSIRTHPVKSAKPLLLQSAYVSNFGVEYDRQFVLLNEHDTVISSSKCPKMVLVRQTITEECVLVEADGMDELKLPLHMNISDGDHLTEVKLLRASTRGVHVSKEADDWFERFTRVQGCKLYCFPSDGKPRYTRDKGETEKMFCTDQDMCKFANACALLVFSEATLGEFNKSLSNHVTIEQFRPNLIFSGCEPFEEDTWGTVQVGEAVLKALYPCSRCPAITVSPKGEKHELAEPLTTLKRVRPACKEKYPFFNGKPILGCNYGVRKEGRISVGDPVFRIHSC